VKKLVALDPAFAEESAFDSSLTRRVWEMRNLTPEALSPSQIALCLRQLIAVNHVAPIAARLLKSEPMLEAELYPGDLLNALLDADANGRLSADQRAELLVICRSALAQAEGADQTLVGAIRRYLNSYHDA